MKRISSYQKLKNKLDKKEKELQVSRQETVELIDRPSSVKSVLIHARHKISKDTEKMMWIGHTS